MRRLFLACLLVGCGGAPRIVQYAQPMATERRGPPPVISLDDVSPPFRRDALAMVDNDVLPKPGPVGATAKDPHALIGEANRAADTEPEEGEADGNTQTYDYERSHSFRVYGCYMRTIDIMFSPGEIVVESTREDAPRTLTKGWQHAFTQSGDGNGHMVQVMQIRPLAEIKDVRWMKVHTTVGPYTFLLEVLPPDETRCMDTVRFRHPKRELKRLIAEEDQREDVKRKGDADGGCTSANYEIEIVDGSPRWVPTLVWRTCEGDHASVHIQFRADVAWSKIPALKSDGGLVHYRYVPEDHVMVVDGLFSRAVLSLGSKEQGYERVVIRALKEPR